MRQFIREIRVPSRSLLIWKRARVFETSTDRDNFPAGEASYKLSRGFVAAEEARVVN